MFPVPFGEAEDDFLTLQQRDTLLLIDETLYPENESLAAKRLTIDREIKEKLKPIDIMATVQQIRDSYVDWSNALIMENFPVTSQTSCVDFWRYVKGYKDKYKSTKANGSTEAI